MKTTKRTWSKVNGVHTSSDGYTLFPRDPRYMNAMCRGADFTGYRRYWAVYGPDGGLVRDYPGAVGGGTIREAKEDLESFERRMKRDWRLRIEQQEQEKASAALQARVSGTTDVVLQAIGQRVDLAPHGLADVAAELVGKYLVRVRSSAHGYLYALSDDGMKRLQEIDEASDPDRYLDGDDYAHSNVPH